MRIKEKHQILAEIDSAFADVERPAEFVDASHCDECAEHNGTLIESDRDQIGLEELGNIGWDPICFVEPEGFLYYFPAMVRLAFDDKSKNEYLNQFLFHCTNEGIDSRFFRHFNSRQVSAVLDIFRFLQKTWKKKMKKMMLSKDVDRAVEIWEKIKNDGISKG